MLFWANKLSYFAAIVHLWGSADRLCLYQCVSTKDSGKTGKDWGVVAGCWLQVKALF